MDNIFNSIRSFSKLLHTWYFSFFLFFFTGNTRSFTRCTSNATLSHWSFSHFPTVWFSPTDTMQTGTWYSRCDRKSESRVTEQGARYDLMQSARLKLNRRENNSKRSTVGTSRKRIPVGVTSNPASEMKFHRTSSLETNGASVKEFSSSKTFIPRQWNV